MGSKVSSNKFEYPKQSPSASSQATTLSTPTSPLETELGRLESFKLVWLDPYVDEDNENQAMQKRLRELVSCLIKFDDSKSCEQWLRNCSSEEKIILIVSGGLGKRIVPTIHSLKPIIAIYVFCLQPDCHILWTQNYSKVRSVISKSAKLLEVISQDQIYFENIEDSKSIKIFKDRPHTRVLDPDSASFIWYQLLLEILISPSYLTSESKPDQLIEILRRHCATDKDGLTLIEQFEQTYEKQNPMTWLTNNTPLARFVNKALRDQSIPMLFYLRFFLVDIHDQLIAYQIPSTHVYKKQLMSSMEIDVIKANLNQYLVFNGFLFTSTQKPDIVSTDTNGDELQTVIIEIDAESSGGKAPFACIQHMIETKNNQDDSTILFMCGSIFKINSFSKNQNSNWTIQLSLVADKDLNMLIKTKETLRQSRDLLKINDLLEQSNQHDKATIYCQQLLRHLPNDHALVPQIQEKLNINQNTQPVSLNSARFVLIGLSTHLSPLSLAMLNGLRSLTNDSVLIYNNDSDIDFDKLPDKTILLFTSSQCNSSMTKKPRQMAKLFILEEDKNKIDQRERFASSEDLIFQLADELYRYYKWEANNDLKSDQNVMGKEKEQLANRIHSELKKIHQKFSANVSTAKPPVCTTTSIIWLNSMLYSENSLDDIHKPFKDIVSSISTLYDEQECYNHLCTDEVVNNVFLIVDIHYEDSSVAGFEQLPNVKKLYRYDQFPSNNEMMTENYNELCFQLTHDLITHYNRLGNECRDRKDEEKAKEMFLNAHKLCELLIQF